MEDGFALIDEGSQAAALSILEALLVHREIEVGLERHDLPEVVLQPGRQSPLVRRLSEPFVVGALIGSRQGEPGSIRVSIDVVELDAVISARPAHIEASSHDRFEDPEAPDVQPAFARPPVALALDPRGEGVGIAPPPLEAAGAHVTDHLAARVVKVRDHSRAVLEEIDVVDLGVHAMVHRPGELPLPAGPRKRVPGVRRRTRARGPWDPKGENQRAEQHHTEGTHTGESTDELQ
jgi:hypothetical protein